MGSGAVSSPLDGGPAMSYSAISIQVTADIAHHYNNLVRTKEGGPNSCIYHMKRFHNWVKSVMIDRAAADVGCLKRRGRPGE